MLTIGATFLGLIMIGNASQDALEPSRLAHRSPAQPSPAKVVEENAAAKAIKTGSDYRVLAAAMEACSQSTTQVAAALRNSDTDVALSTLRTAQATCKDAASNLRKTPIPTINSPLAAEGMEEMDAGLHQVEEALLIMDSSPASARTKAHSGMLKYKSGLDKTTEASS